MSEADYSWSPFSIVADPKVKLAEDTLHEMLNLNSKYEGEILSKTYAKEFWENYIDENPYGAEEAAQYRALLKKMKENLSNIQIILASFPRSAQVRLYIVGRAKDGAVVGFSTASMFVQGQSFAAGGSLIIVLDKAQVSVSLHWTYDLNLQL